MHRESRSSAHAVAAKVMEWPDRRPSRGWFPASRCDADSELGRPFGGDVRFDRGQQHRHRPKGEIVAPRIMTIYGTRPEAIKVAPVIKAIEEAPGLSGIPVVTGQHREVLDQVNSLFEIVPEHDLDIMNAGQTLNAVVSKVIRGIDEILEREQPDAVIVQGDTSSVMGAAVASFNRQVPVVHLEAGLRSGDIT